MDICSDGDILNIIRIALTVLKIIRIVLPLILIIILTIDYYEVIFQNNNKGLSDCNNRALKRLVAALAILFAPTIINVVGNTTNEIDFIRCIQEATPEGINNAFIKTAESLVKTAEETKINSDIIRAENQIRRVKDGDIREDLYNRINTLKESIKQEETSEPITQKITEQIEIKSGSSLKSYTSSNNQTLQYYEIIPNNPTNKMPLIIYLHGDWEADDINRIEDLPIYNYAKNNNQNYVFIAPHSPYKDWISANITLALKELIDNVINDYDIDKKHIIIMGASRGSIGTWNMIAKYGNFFSAAVPISYYPTTNGDANAYVSVPIFGVSGNSGSFESSINSGMINMINRIKSAGGIAEMHTISGKTHNDIAQNLPLDEMFNWVLSK